MKFQSFHRNINAMSSLEYRKNKYLLFEASKELFAFDINDVIELASVTYIHRLPHKADSCVLGIANINGDICIILTLSKILKLENLSFSEKKGEDINKLILCKNSTSKIAFLVDEIHCLSEDDDFVDIKDDDFEGISNVSVFTVAKIKNREKVYTILDIELLINAFERNYL